MVALEFAASFPSLFRAAVVFAAPAAHTAWAIGWNHVQRRALEAGGPEAGLAIARMVGMLTYRTPGELEGRFGRQGGADGRSRSSRIFRATAPARRALRRAELPDAPWRHGRARRRARARRRRGRARGGGAARHRRRDSRRRPLSRRLVRTWSARGRRGVRRAPLVRTGTTGSLLETDSAGTILAARSRGRRRGDQFSGGGGGSGAGVFFLGGRAVMRRPVPASPSCRRSRGRPTRRPGRGGRRRFADREDLVVVELQDRPGPGLRLAAPSGRVSA